MLHDEHGAADVAVPDAPPLFIEQHYLLKSREVALILERGDIRGTYLADDDGE